MNIYLRELNRNKKALIIWTVIMIAYIAGTMALYPTMVDEMKNYEEIVKGMPDAFSAVFGLNKVSLSNLFGYYSVYGYFFTILLGTIYATILSAGIISKEEGDKTIEFLLSKPVTRREIVTSKILSALTNILIFNGLLILTTFISFELVKTEAYSMKTFILLNLAPILVQITFASLGLLVSVFITKSKKILPIALGIVLINYFLGTMSDITEKMKGLKYISPFKYVDAAQIIQTGRIETKYVIIMLTLSIVFIGLAYFIYERKDITV